MFKNGKIVQSKNFNQYQILGNPIPAIKRLSEWASDELIFLDISENKVYDLDRDDYNFCNSSNFLEIIENISEKVYMPITIGGNIRSIKDIELRIERCADKVCINTNGFKDKKFIYEASKIFGNQCIVSSVDVKKISNKFFVFINGGKDNTKVELFEWVKFLQDQGAGEILLNSIDRDGSGDGYDIDMIENVISVIKIPLIILGGVGDFEDFEVGLNYEHVDAVAAANIFHYKDQSVYYAKKMLYEKGYNIRNPNLLNLELNEIL